MSIIVAEKLGFNGTKQVNENQNHSRVIGAKRQAALFQATTNRVQRLLADYAEVRRRKTKGQREVWRECKNEIIFIIRPRLASLIWKQR